MLMKSDVCNHDMHRTLTVFIELGHLYTLLIYYTLITRLKNEKKYSNKYSYYI